MKYTSEHDLPYWSDPSFDSSGNEIGWERYEDEDPLPIWSAAEESKREADEMIRWSEAGI